MDDNFIPEIAIIIGICLLLVGVFIGAGIADEYRKADMETVVGYLDMLDEYNTTDLQSAGIVLDKEEIIIYGDMTKLREKSVRR